MSQSRVLKRVLILTVSLLVVLSPLSVWASSWEDFFSELSFGDTIQEGVAQQGGVFTADYSFTVLDGDFILGNYSDADVVSNLILTNKYTGQTISFSGTRLELEAWAKQNADELYKIIFLSGGPDKALAGESNATMTAVQGVSRIFTSLEQLGSRDVLGTAASVGSGAMPGTAGDMGGGAMPGAAGDESRRAMPGFTGDASGVDMSGAAGDESGRDMPGTAGELMGGDTRGSLEEVKNNDIRVVAQYDFFKVGPDRVRADGYSGLLGYTTVVGETGRHAIGVEIPFRSLEIDDEVDSSLIYLMLCPFYEYSDTYGPGRYMLTAGAGLGMTYFNSELFDSGAYLQYSMMVGGGYARTITPWLEARVGLAYQYMDGHIPESNISGDFKWIAKALNDQPAEQTITPGLGATAYIMPGFMNVQLNIYRVHQVGSGVEDGQEIQTVTNLFLSITPGSWRLNVGYKTSFELEEFEDHSFVVSARYLW
jgi:hypothetical protein